MTLEGEEFPALIRVPHFYRLILAGAGQTLAIGTERNAVDEVFAIGSDHAAWAYNYQTGGWRSLGGYVTEISGTAGDTLFALAADHTFWEHDGSG